MQEQKTTSEKKENFKKSPIILNNGEVNWGAIAITQLFKQIAISVKEQISINPEKFIDQTQGDLEINDIITQKIIDNYQIKISNLLEQTPSEFLKCKNIQAQKELNSILYSLGLLHLNRHSDWKISRKRIRFTDEHVDMMKLVALKQHIKLHLKEFVMIDDEMVEQMKLPMLKEHIRVHIEEFLKTINNDQSAYKPIIVADMGPGDGALLNELLQPYSQRKEDAINGIPISKVCHSFGIGKEYLFGLQGLLMNIIKPEKLNNEMRELLRILGDIITQEMDKAKEKDFLENSVDQDFNDLDDDINIIKKIIYDPKKYFPNIQNFSDIKTSGEFPGDTSLIISEEALNMFEELFENPHLFQAKYFCSDFEHMDLKDQISSITQNIILSRFEDIDQVLPKEAKIDFINSCRSSSHLPDDKYQEYVIALCKRLANGGIHRCDGIIESYSRFNRHKLLNIQKILGDDFRITLIAQNKTVDNQQVLTPCSMIIQKAFIKTDGSKVAYNQKLMNELMELTYQRLGKDVGKIEYFDISQLAEKCPQENLKNTIRNHFRHIFKLYESIFVHETEDLTIHKAGNHFSRTLHEQIEKLINQAFIEHTNNQKPINYQNTEREIINKIIESDHFLKTINALTHRVVKIEHNGYPLDISYFFRKAIKNRENNQENNEKIIVYIHGLGCSKRDFIRAINAGGLDEYNIVGIDLPGFGLSPYPRQSVTPKTSEKIDKIANLFPLPNFAIKGLKSLSDQLSSKFKKPVIRSIGDLEKIIYKTTKEIFAEKIDLENLLSNQITIEEFEQKYIDKFGVKKFVYMGHSMGGLTGVEYCDQHQEQIKAFIAIESDLDSSDNFISQRVLKYNRQNFIDHGFKELQKEIASSDDEEVKKYVQIMKRMSSAEAFYDCAKAIVAFSRGNNIKNKLHKISDKNIKILYFYGSKNKKYFQKRLSEFNFSNEEIEDTGHFVMYRKYISLLDKAINFLEKNNI